MKRIFSILFALVLILSFSLIPAAPVMATGTTTTLSIPDNVYRPAPFDVSSTTTNDGTAYTNVRFNITVSGPTAFTGAREDIFTITHLNGSPNTQGINDTFALVGGDFIGGWGPEVGFGLTDPYDVTSVFTVQMNDGGTAPVGDYQVTVDLVDLTPDPDFTLASATSSFTLSADTLHVGASQQFTTIQDAIDAAQPGDTIIVHEGSYNETVTIASDDYDLTLVGKGAIIAGDGLRFGISLQAGTHHISISGFEITGFDDFWDAAGIEGWTGSDKPDWTAGAIHHITIHHNNIHNNNDGINIGAWDWSAGSPPSWRHNNITIQHNVVSNNVDRGINLWAVSDSTVARNEILDNGGNGLVFNHVSDSNANHNEIHGNDVVGLGVYNGATGNNFNHNDITNNDNLGILLTGWQYPTTGNTFVRNDARDNDSWDIRCIQQWGSQVYGNKWIKNKYDDAYPDPPQ